MLDILSWFILRHTPPCKVVDTDDTDLLIPWEDDIGTFSFKTVLLNSRNWYVKPFPCIHRQTAHCNRLKLSRRTHYATVQAMLIFDHALLSLQWFLTCGRFKYLCSFSDIGLIKLNLNLMPVFIALDAFNSFDSAYSVFVSIFYWSVQYMSDQNKS